MPLRPARFRPLLVAGVIVVVTSLLAACGSGEDVASEVADPDAAATATGAPLSPSTSPTSPSPSVESSAPSTTSPSPTPSASPSTPAPAAVPAALRFEATTVGGRSFDGASLAGRPVVLWFWAPWCTVCARQAPQVADLAEKYGDRVAFVGVGSKDDATAVRRFAGRAPGPVHLSDVDGALYRSFRVSEQSSFVILDARGREVLRSGYDDDAKVASTIASLAG